LEDSYNGVHAAAAAGMPVVMVPDLLPPTDEMRATALRVVDSLLDVLPCFPLPARLPARSSLAGG
jgi:beta-phosphoglucomutase-like phosphatase (HAD superfamily)